MNLDKIRFSHRTVLIYTMSLLGLTLLHHIDHVLRYDHSGWPFTPQVNPFTYSLIVYPAIVALILVKRKKVRITIATILAIMLVGAHTFAETPYDQYHTWAQNSSIAAESLHHPNLLNVASPPLGIAATTLAMALNIGVVLLPFVYWREESYT